MKLTHLGLEASNHYGIEAENNKRGKEKNKDLSLNLTFYML